jgi:hypothetical protein
MMPVVPKIKVKEKYDIQNNGHSPCRRIETIESSEPPLVQLYNAPDPLMKFHDPAALLIEVSFVRSERHKTFYSRFRKNEMRRSPIVQRHKKDNMSFILEKVMSVFCRNQC